MKIIVKCFVHQELYGPGYCTFACDMSAHGWVFVGETEFEYDVPDNFNPTAARIATLEKKLDSMSAEYQRNCAAIRGQISDLQCIEHSPAGAA